MGNNRIINIVILIVILVGMHILITKIRGKKVKHSAINIIQEAVVVENLDLRVVIKTNKGDINIKLFPEVAPVTVLNMITLAQNKYYDGIKFHRVISDFMIQGGDPTGTGAGGPGYNFHDEFKKEVVFDKPGILAMANAGPGTNGSQFFITHVETPWLNHKHTIFGEVVSPEDQKVVNAIRQGDTITTIEVVGDATKLIEANQEIVTKIEAAIKNRK